MKKAVDVKNIVWHTTAGFSGVSAIEDFWRLTLGWKGKGYSAIIDTDGKIFYLNNATAKHGYTTDYNGGKCFTFITNGVEGNNDDAIHIAYIGGVEAAGKDKKGQIIWKGKDTRTPAQKKSQILLNQQVIGWLSANDKNVCSDLGFVGHRDFSPDGDKNGVIAPWERIKECPCFEPIAEFREYASEDRRGLLPSVATPKKSVVIRNSFVIHSVISGDSLSKIAIKYKTTVSDLKTRNGLKDDKIKIGQKLKVAA